MTDPFRSTNWPPAQAELVEKIWLLHDAYRSSDDGHEVSKLESELSRSRSLAADHVQDLRDALRERPQASAAVEQRDISVPMGRLLALAVGLDKNWQIGLVDELSKGFYLTRRICRYPAEKGLELPPDSNVTVDRFLWKESVRAKNYFAAGMALARDVSRKHRIILKREVLTALEYLRLAEVCRFAEDVSIKGLSLFRRTQIELQARFGRATFKS